MKTINKSVVFKALLLALLGTISILIVDAAPNYSDVKKEEVENEDRMHLKLPVVKSKADSFSREYSQSYWHEEGKDFIRKQQRVKQNRNKAKNVILFLGDGMGLATLAAARAYMGGEEVQLSFEEFPYTGFSKTYSVDKIVPDSACTSTAYLTGVKANYGTVGVNGYVERDDCEAMKNTNNHVFSIAKWAMDAGKGAGLVTTARVTHASPAGLYAHTADREWETDTEIKEWCGENSGLDDIAVQLIHGEVGSKLKVMLGGGKKMFRDPIHDKKGLRSDGRNLLQEFGELNPNNIYVETEDELKNVDPSKVNRLLGLFKNGHMNYHLDAEDDPTNTEPTLEEMTRKAIEVMQTEKNGYFLFVEGGKIDMGHHYAWARHALDEASEFSKAISAAVELTNSEETLIIVTSDHSHTFSMSGYQERGSDFFGPAISKADDDLPYMPLSYANGPSYETHYNIDKFKRRNPTKIITGANDDVFPAMVPLIKETHGGEDVAIFALGPWAHLFSGTVEQNSIPHMMAYASCIGSGPTACK